MIYLFLGKVKLLWNWKKSLMRYHFFIDRWISMRLFPDVSGIKK